MIDFTVICNNSHDANTAREVARSAGCTYCIITPEHKEYENIKQEFSIHTLPTIFYAVDWQTTKIFRHSKKCNVFTMLVEQIDKDINNFIKQINDSKSQEAAS